MCKAVTETQWRKVTILQQPSTWKSIAWIEDIHILAPVGSRFEYDTHVYYVTDVTVEVDTREEAIKVILSVRPA